MTNVADTTFEVIFCYGELKIILGGKNVPYECLELMRRLLGIHHSTRFFVAVYVKVILGGKNTP